MKNRLQPLQGLAIPKHQLGHPRPIQLASGGHHFRTEFANDFRQSLATWPRNLASNEVRIHDLNTPLRQP